MLGRSQWIVFCAVSATAASSEENMGEPGSHGMVSKGLLFQDEEKRTMSHEIPCHTPTLSECRNTLLPSVFSEVPYGPCNYPEPGLGL